MEEYTEKENAFKYTGTITEIMPIQSGTSKSGNAWRKLDIVLVQGNKPFKATIWSFRLQDIINEIGAGSIIYIEGKMDGYYYNSKPIISHNITKIDVLYKAPSIGDSRLTEPPPFDDLVNDDIPF
jgi:hypothetical protein